MKKTVYIVKFGITDQKSEFRVRKVLEISLGSRGYLYQRSMKDSLTIHVRTASRTQSRRAAVDIGVLNTLLNQRVFRDKRHRLASLFLNNEKRAQIRAIRQKFRQVDQKK